MDQKFYHCALDFDSFFPDQTFSRSKVLGRSDHRRFFKIHERNSPWTSLITSQLNRQYKQRSTVDVSNCLYYKPMTDRHSGINCCHWSHEESNGEGGFRQEIDEDISRVSFSSQNKPIFVSFFCQNKPIERKIKSRNVERIYKHAYKNSF